jgi:hypothetical protein
MLYLVHAGFPRKGNDSMTTRIMISVNERKIRAELFDTETGRAVAAALPIVAAPNEWGDEFYFEVPVDLPLDESAATSVRVGDIGYWPPGKALALFFGPTPLSSGAEPVPASAVNIVGRILDDAVLLRSAKGAHRLKIERI